MAAAGIEAMSYGGIGTLHRRVGKLGSPKAIDEHINLLKVLLPYHESDHALNRCVFAVIWALRKWSDVLTIAE